MLSSGYFFSRSLRTSSSVCPGADLRIFAVLSWNLNCACSHISLKEYSSLSRVGDVTEPITWEVKLYGSLDENEVVVCRNWITTDRGNGQMIYAIRLKADFLKEVCSVAAGKGQGGTSEIRQLRSR